MEVCALLSAVVVFCSSNNFWGSSWDKMVHIKISLWEVRWRGGRRHENEFRPSEEPIICACTFVFGILKNRSRVRFHIIQIYSSYHRKDRGPGGSALCYHRCYQLRRRGYCVLVRLFGCLSVCLLTTNCLFVNVCLLHWLVDFVIVCLFVGYRSQF